MSKQQHRIRNWSDYNAALVNRGRITLFSTTLSSKKGRPCTYSDSAMTCLLLITSVFKLDFRKLQGFSEFLVKIMGLDIMIPSYTQICRRQSTLEIDLSHIKKDEPAKSAC